MNRLGILLAAFLGVAPLAFGAGAGEPSSVERATQLGPVQAWIRLAPADPRIGDPLRLELEVQAEPDVELLMPEFGEALDRFAIVEFVPAETQDASGATTAHQRYTLQASRSGIQRIPPLRIEFVDRRPGRPPAPEGEDAYELLTEPVEFEVAAVLPDDAPLELRPALGKLGPRTVPGRAWWPFVLGGLVLLGALAPWALRRWEAHRQRVERRSAYAIARAELDALLAGPLPRAERMDPFYVRLSDIVRRYLERRFGLRSPELTTEEFLGVLAKSPELSPEHQRLLARFLELADLVKFAHHLPSPHDVEESVAATRRFLDETRDDLGSLRPGFGPAQPEEGTGVLGA